MAVFDWDADFHELLAGGKLSGLDGTPPDLTSVGMWGPQGFALSITINFFVAMRHFNERRVDVLPDLARLGACSRNVTTVRYCETGGAPRIAVAAAQRRLFSADAHVLLGFASSEESKVVSAVASQQCGPVTEPTPVLSHWSSATDLRDKSKYPLFARTFPSDRDLARGVVSLVHQLKYRTAAVLYLNGDSGPTFAQDVLEIMHEHAMDVALVPFDMNLEVDVAMHKALLGVRHEEVSVVVCVLYVEYFSPLAAQAVELGYGLDGSVQWIFTFADRDPTEEDVRDDPALAHLLHGSLLVKLTADRAQPSSLFAKYRAMWPTLQNDTGLVNFIRTVLPPHGSTLLQGMCDDEKFNSRGVFDAFDGEGGYFPNTAQYAYDLWAFTYDAVMAMGIAACGGLDATQPPPTIANASMLIDMLKTVDFEGLSGRVRFNPVTLDRLSETVMVDLYNFEVVVTTTSSATSSSHKLESFTFRRVGTWNLTEDRMDLLDPSGDGLVFHQGRGLAFLPADRTVVVEDKSYLPEGLRILAYVEVGVMLGTCVVVWLWLVRNRHHKVLVNSQWGLMQGVIVGCAVLSLSLMAHVGATDDPTTTSNTMNPDALCQAQIALYLVGMEIAMLALIAKSTRLYSVVSNTRLRRHVLRLRTAFGVLVIVVVFEVAVFVAWWYVAPTRFTREVVYRIRGQPTLSKGSCQWSGGGLPFLAVVLILHSITLLGMGYSANLVKRFPSDYQDSRHVFYAIYVMVQVYFVALPTYWAVLYEVIGRFVVWNVIVVASWGVLGGYTFVPKWVLLRGSPAPEGGVAVAKPQEPSPPSPPGGEMQ